MLQIPKSIINTNISPTNYTQNSNTYLLHHRLPAAALPHPEPQVRHQPTSGAGGAATGRRKLLREPPLQTKDKSPFPPTIHHRENSLHTLHHHIPRDPQAVQLLHRHHLPSTDVDVEPEYAALVDVELAAGLHDRGDAAAAVADVDGEDEVMQRQPRLGRGAEAAGVGGAAEGEEGAVGGGGVEVGEGGVGGGADGLPEVVGGHGGGPRLAHAGGGGQGFGAEAVGHEVEDLPRRRPVLGHHFLEKNFSSSN